jgi:glutathione S-transferase
LRPVIQLIQFPWSPFCIVQRRILEYAGAKFKITNIPNGDRRLVWKVTGGKYYAVPVIRDDRKVLIESADDSQDIARHLDRKFHLDLFPARWAGVQELLWRHIEDAVEGAGFRLNDIYWREMVPNSDALPFVRHKERKFGRGCLDRWRAEQKQWLAALQAALAPFERMLATRPFLLDDCPRFVDFDLYGMLGNFLYSGHYALPKRHARIRDWYARMAKVKFSHYSK